MLRNAVAKPAFILAKGGVLVSKDFYSHRHSRWFIFAKATMKKRYSICYTVFDCIINSNYFLLREISNAVPANVITANPAIGATSPVFAAFALAVVDPCPV